MKTKRNEQGGLRQALAVFLAAVVIVVLPLVLVWAADITPGYTFSDGEKNVTHTKLNNAAAGTVNTTFYSGKAGAGSNPNTAWEFLLRDTTTDVFKKTSLQTAVFDHTSLLSARNFKSGPVTADTFLISDSAASGAYKQMNFSNLIDGASALLVPDEADEVGIFDGANYKKIALAKLFSGALNGADYDGNETFHAVNASGGLVRVILSNLVNFAMANVAQTQVTNTVFDTAIGTWHDLTNLSVTITPRTSAHRVLVSASISGVATNGGAPVFFRFLRGSTPIGLGLDDGSSRVECTAALDAAATISSLYTTAFQWLDSPNTTSATTYKVQVWMAGVVNAAFYWNRSQADSNGTGTGRGVSTITVQEVQ